MELPCEMSESVEHLQPKDVEKDMCFHYVTPRLRRLELGSD